MFHRHSSKTNCATTLFNQRDSADEIEIVIEGVGIMRTTVRKPGSTASPGGTTMTRALAPGDVEMRVPGPTTGIEELERRRAVTDWATPLSSCGAVLVARTPIYYQRYIIDKHNKPLRSQQAAIDGAHHFYALTHADRRAYSEKHGDECRRSHDAGLASLGEGLLQQQGRRGEGNRQLRQLPGRRPIWVGRVSHRFA
jgi:hypothetical protein